MARNLNEILADLPASRKDRISARFEELNDAVNLAQLRQLIGVSQSELAGRLSMKQPSISKVEGQGDLQLSTLVRYVEGLGAKLKISVEMPDGTEYPVRKAFPKKKVPKHRARYKAGAKADRRSKNHKQAAD